MADGPAPLKLRAHDLEDLSVLSSMVQDALAPLGDMAFLRDERRFVIALNRFRWEEAGTFPPFYRTHAGLRFDNVTAVQRRNIAPSDRDSMLSLLSIAYHEGTVMLSFAGDKDIRLAVNALAVALEDLDEPWPTQWKPGHEPE
jgi:hypothetical protein